jgi:hypothetical protein
MRFFWGAGTTVSKTEILSGQVIVTSLFDPTSPARLAATLYVPDPVAVTSTQQAPVSSAVQVPTTVPSFVTVTVAPVAGLNEQSATIAQIWHGGQYVTGPGSS